MPRNDVGQTPRAFYADCLPVAMKAGRSPVGNPTHPLGVGRRVRAVTAAGRAGTSGERRVLISSAQLRRLDLRAALRGKSCPLARFAQRS